MITLIAIPLTCWLCVLIVTPRKPLSGNEVEELVYSRLLGRQHLLRLLAIIVTAMTFFTIVLTLPSQSSPVRGVFQVGQQNCTYSLDRLPRCYTLQADGRWMADDRWMQEPSDSAGALLTPGSTGSLNPNATPAGATYPIKP